LAKRLLILRAGSSLSNSLVHSLRSGDPSLYIVGCHDDRFVLTKSLAERNYLAPASPERVRLRALRRIIEIERIDLVMPTTDEDVLMIARLREKLPCRIFLPRIEVIKRCQDKFALTTFLRRQGIPAPRTYAISSLKKIDGLFRRFVPHPLLWCRVRKGSGSFAAIPVKRPDQAQAWIKYWHEMRGIPVGSFTLSEYLPGRDFCVQCLWRNGTLVLAKMAERISYIDTGSPSGVSSMAALAKTIFEPRAMKICVKAIRALDPKASGAFFVDMKENEKGIACITEINAGRFASMTNLHDLAGRHNMASLYVRLGMGGRVKLPSPYDFAEDYYVVRSVDTLPAVIHADRLFEGIEDAA
jgi:carbamoylphosphate synthase large subunit